MSWLSKLKQGLSKTAALSSFGAPTLQNLDAVEEALLSADVGYQTTTEIMDSVRREKPRDEASFHQIVRDILIQKITPRKKLSSTA